MMLARENEACALFLLFSFLWKLDCGQMWWDGCKPSPRVKITTKMVKEATERKAVEEKQKDSPERVTVWMREPFVTA